MHSQEQPLEFDQHDLFGLDSFFVPTNNDECGEDFWLAPLRSPDAHGADDDLLSPDEIAPLSDDEAAHLSKLSSSSSNNSNSNNHDNNNNRGIKSEGIRLASIATHATAVFIKKEAPLPEDDGGCFGDHLHHSLTKHQPNLTEARQAEAQEDDDDADAANDDDDEGGCCCQHNGEEEEDDEQEDTTSQDAAAHAEYGEYDDDLLSNSAWLDLANGCLSVTGSAATSPLKSPVTLALQSRKNSASGVLAAAAALAVHPTKAKPMAPASANVKADVKTEPLALSGANDDDDFFLSDSECTATDFGDLHGMVASGKTTPEAMPCCTSSSASASTTAASNKNGNSATANLPHDTHHHHNHHNHNHHHNHHHLKNLPHPPHHQHTSSNANNNSNHNNVFITEQDIPDMVNLFSSMYTPEETAAAAAARFQPLSIAVPTPQMYSNMLAHMAAAHAHAQVHAQATAQAHAYAPQPQAPTSNNNSSSSNISATANGLEYFTPPGVGAMRFMDASSLFLGADHLSPATKSGLLTAAANSAAAASTMRKLTTTYGVPIAPLMQRTLPLETHARHAHHAHAHAHAHPPPPRQTLKPKALSTVATMAAAHASMAGTRVPKISITPDISDFKLVQIFHAFCDPATKLLPLQAFHKLVLKHQIKEDSAAAAATTISAETQVRPPPSLPPPPCRV